MIVRYSPQYDEDIHVLCEEFSRDVLGSYGLETKREAIENIKKAVKDHSFLLIKDGRCVGVIAGYFVEGVGNNRKALQEVIWYVQKDNRRGGLNLLASFEQHAKEIGADMIVMALMCNSMMDRLAGLYRRLGYTPFEVQYMKEI